MWLLSFKSYKSTSSTSLYKAGQNPGACSAFPGNHLFLLQHTSEPCKGFALQMATPAPWAQPEGFLQPAYRDRD